MLSHFCDNYLINESFRTIRAIRTKGGNCLMKPTQLIHQARLQEWAANFSDQKASGLTVKQWCDQHNCSIHKYNYWKHLLKEEAVSQALPEIVPITLPESSTMVTHNSTVPVRTNCTNRTTDIIRLSVNDVTIEVTPDVSEGFLQSIIKAVRHA